MNTKIGLASMVLVGAIGLSGVALAKTTNTPNEKTDRCMKLEHEFDTAKKDHVTPALLASAQKQRDQGAALSEGNRLTAAPRSPGAARIRSVPCPCRQGRRGRWREGPEERARGHRRQAQEVAAAGWALQAP